MTGPRPLLPAVPDPERPAADILAATAAATGVPAAVVLDRAIRAWAALVAAAEAGNCCGSADADHLDRLTFTTQLGGGGPPPERDASPAEDPTTQAPATAGASPAAEDLAGKETSGTT